MAFSESRFQLLSEFTATHNPRRGYGYHEHFVTSHTRIHVQYQQCELLLAALMVGRTHRACWKWYMTPEKLASHAGHNRLRIQQRRPFVFNESARLGKAYTIDAKVLWQRWNLLEQVSRFPGFAQSRLNPLGRIVLRGVRCDEVR